MSCVGVGHRVGTNATHRATLRHPVSGRPSPPGRPAKFALDPMASAGPRFDLRPLPREARMHELSIPPHVLERVIRRAGRPHPFDVIEPAKTALVIIDMQNYFMKPGFQGEVPMARKIVPTVNRLAAATRELGGHVVWVKNTTSGTRESWSVLHDWLQTPDRRDRRYASMELGQEGHALWSELDTRPEDAQIVK